jgi:hypothetical protein
MPIFVRVLSLCGYAAVIIGLAYQTIQTRRYRLEIVKKGEGFAAENRAREIV